MKRPLTVLVAAVAMAGIAGPALAAWTADGSGSGSARARALAPPTGGAAATPTTTSLALSWTPPTNSAGIAVSYTVSRDGGAAAAACTNISTTSCTDTFASSTTARTFTYAVTAKVGTNWTAVSTTFPGSPTTATSVGTATKLRFAACGTGATTVIGRDGVFASKVQTLNASNVLVADNGTAITVTLSVSGTGNDGPWSPTSLSIPVSSGETSASATINGNDNNGWSQFTVTAAAPGLTSATCVLSRT